ncbi:hypothetical protein PTSG_01871 [Salpingoeca rosetta]|uniref:Uncharacterized protein n=1 Tax=Salpingoeca rosetta (strain ATCC 50818 / BSB-021) TaxID=946362 RepID=F2TZ71_SALR5|nr:uncharacterized protein PTSG_01871 [Salpingoeca rosetta]EGD78895.1 hypothetical protein PTSG_01871 [Salpingoeca rosetta]|eukprot:XP_004997851.1 hypothetical protein PTSG_01871 [Salpingoeca rosetta]
MAETCSSSYALQFQAIGTIIAACWVFGMTALIFAHIRSCVVFKCSRSHAMHIDLVETNYANGYDLAWLDQGWYLTTPFKRSYAYYTIWIILHKALVVVAYTVLSDIPFAQAGAVLGLFLVSSLMLSLCKPFRIANANLIASCYHIALMAASLLVLMRRTDGSQALLESPYLDREVIAAVAFAGVIAGFVFATWLVSAARHRSQWPAPSSLDAYPPGPLAAMAEASRAMAACWESPWHLAPTHTLAASIHAVQSYVQDPDTPEGVTLQLRHLLDSLLLCYAQVAPHSIYSQAPRASVWTCQKQLALMMPEMRRRMDERDEEYLLMPRHFKRYQLKMVAFLAFRELLLRVRERGHQPRGDTFAIQVRPPSGSSDSASLLDTSEA